MSSISSVSSSTRPYPTDTQSPWQQRAQDFKALKNALKSGDLSGAQQAFSTLLQDQQTTSPGVSTANTTNASSQNSQTSNAFQALQSALNSGDLSGAQQAFASLQQSMKSGAAGRSGHHHHHGGSMNGATQPTPSTASGATDQTANALLNVQA